MGDLFDEFKDLLQEVPDAEDALRQWRDRNARAVMKRRLERDRQQRLEEALAWCAQRRSDSGSA